MPFVIKSYKEILDEMVWMLPVHMKEEYTHPGSFILMLLEMVAQREAAMHEMIAAMRFPQTWTNPDGSQRSTRPRDGEIYDVTDISGNKDTWQWEGTKDLWVRKSIRFVTGAKAVFKVNGIPIAYADGVSYTTNHDKKETKCECGSEKVGSPKHSSWCEKYNPDT